MHAIVHPADIQDRDGGALVLVIDRLQITAEESALLANFGADYEAYRASVPRWLDRRSLAIGH